MEPNFSENLLNIQEAAARYKVSISLLYKACANRDVSSHRLGRRVFFNPEELDLFLFKRSRREAIQPRRGATKQAAK